MTNSFISSLAVIDTSSVTNSSSMFFFGQDNDTPKLVPADVLQSILGNPLGIYVEVASAVQVLSVSINTGEFEISPRIDYDRAVIDSYGAFNPSSKGIITMPFQGYVRVAAHYHLDIRSFPSSLIDVAQQITVYCNSNPVIGGQMTQADVNDVRSTPAYLERTIQTAPFSVTHGDVIWATMGIHEVVQNSGGLTATFGNSPTSSQRGMWMWVKPLLVEVGSVGAGGGGGGGATLTLSPTADIDTLNIMAASATISDSAYMWVVWNSTDYKLPISDAGKLFGGMTGFGASRNSFTFGSNYHVVQSTSEFGEYKENGWLTSTNTDVLVVPNDAVTKIRVIAIADAFTEARLSINSVDNIYLTDQDNNSSGQRNIYSPVLSVSSGDEIRIQFTDNTGNFENRFTNAWNVIPVEFK